MGFSIYCDTPTKRGQLVVIGKDKKPYEDEEQAKADAADRNKRAADLGIARVVDYFVGAGFTGSIEG